MAPAPLSRPDDSVHPRRRLEDRCHPAVTDAASSIPTNVSTSPRTRTPTRSCVVSWAYLGRSNPTKRPRTRTRTIRRPTPRLPDVSVAPPPPDPHGSRRDWARHKAQQHRTRFWVSAGVLTIIGAGFSGSAPPLPLFWERWLVGAGGGLVAFLLVVGGTRWYAYLRAPHEQLVAHVEILERKIPGTPPDRPPPRHPKLSIDVGEGEPWDIPGYAGRRTKVVRVTNSGNDLAHTCRAEVEGLGSIPVKLGWLNARHTTVELEAGQSDFIAVSFPDDQPRDITVRAWFLLTPGPAVRRFHVTHPSDSHFPVFEPNDE